MLQHKKSHNTAIRKHRFNQVLAHLHLTDLYQWFIHNQTPQRCPKGYHSIVHTELTVLNTWGMLAFTYLLDKFKAAAIIAALFHDFGHSQGDLPDTDNVEIAAKAAEQALDCFFVDCSWKHCEHFLKQEVPALIRKSVWPRELSIKEDPVASILADADLMSIYDESEGLNLWEGLFEELWTSSRSNSINEAKNIAEAFEVFKSNTCMFPMQVNWYTPIGRDMAVKLDFFGIYRELSNRPVLSADTSRRLHPTRSGLRPAKQNRKTT